MPALRHVWRVVPALLALSALFWLVLAFVAGSQRQYDRAAYFAALAVFFRIMANDASVAPPAERRTAAGPSLDDRIKRAQLDKLYAETALAHVEARRRASRVI